MQISRVKRLTVNSVIVSLVFNLCLTPLSVVAAENGNGSASGLASRDAAQGLQRLKEKVSKDKARIRNRVQQNVAQPLDLGEVDLTDSASLVQLNDNVLLLHEEVLADFAEQGLDLMNKGLPQAVLDRHAAALAAYEAEFTALQDRIEELRDADTLAEQDQLIDSLETFLEGESFAPTPETTPVEELPFGPPSSEVREPIVDEDDLAATLDQHNPGKMDRLADTIVSALVSSAYAAEAAGPTPLDLQENVEVKFTDAIVDLAETLNHDPVEIYTWVHNNIAYIPSYGSIQGADLTLQTRAGNDMDTASLLIALLRASGIPARYAYGTIEVPVEQAMNWVGGVSVAAAAQNLLGQGGVPTSGVVTGGAVVALRMEHVWVEAWTDYLPSRGINNSTGDSWVPMDASFKLRDGTPPMDLGSQGSFSGADALVAQALSSATLNQSAGWVQNVDMNPVDASISSYETSVRSQINATNAGFSTGDLFGAQTIRYRTAAPLAAGLPYRKVLLQNAFSEVPDNLRQKFRYRLATLSYGLPGSTFLSVELPTAAIGARNISISFTPATQADLDVLAAYHVPPDLEATEAQAFELPGYLIDMKADFALDDEVTVSGLAGNLGEELYETLAFKRPGQTWSASVINYPVVGEYRAIGLDLQGFGPVAASRLGLRATSVEDTLANGTIASIEALDKYQLIGDQMSGVIANYFALNDVQDRLLATEFGVVMNRMPSFGIVSTEFEVAYFFGVPRTVVVAGYAIDVDRYTYQAVAKDNSNLQFMKFNLAVGPRTSAMEHLVLEEGLSFELDTLTGVSAAKVLARANATHQKIWFVSSGNLSQALAGISLSTEDEQDISNAVSAGRLAIVPESPVLIGNWYGAGYYLLDKASGAGAYKISGGTNGGAAITNQDIVDTNKRALTILQNGERVKQSWVGGRFILNQDSRDLIIRAMREFNVVLIGSIIESWEFAVNNGGLDEVQREYLIRAITGMKVAHAMADGMLSPLPFNNLGVAVVMMVHVVPYMNALNISLYRQGIH